MRRTKGIYHLIKWKWEYVNARTDVLGGRMTGDFRVTASIISVIPLGTWMLNKASRVADAIGALDGYNFDLNQYMLGRIHKGKIGTIYIKTSREVYAAKDSDLELQKAYDRWLKEQESKTT